MKNINTIPLSVRRWLFIGVVLVFVQVVLGGITRLTDSGLSITEWAVIQGTLPPMTEYAWQEAFEQYQNMAKKQFEALHADMTLSEFKVIYFWEYFHRLWARLMGLIFLFPFLYFLRKKWIPKWLLKRLGIVILLASLAAVFGFIMVASGLNNDTRTWVSAYKLVIHLGIATALFAYLFQTWQLANQPDTSDGHLSSLRKFALLILWIVFLQILFGGLMAGMRAGLLHPYFPAFVEGQRLIGALEATSEGALNTVVDYESSSFMKAVVQIMHRLTAWVLTGLIILFFLNVKKSKKSRKLELGNKLLLLMLIIQFLLGVLTVINCFGSVPIVYGALHQAGALILLAILLFVSHQFSTTTNTKM